MPGLGKPPGGAPPAGVSRVHIQHTVCCSSTPTVGNVAGYMAKAQAERHEAVKTSANDALLTAKQPAAFVCSPMGGGRKPPGAGAPAGGAEPGGGRITGAPCICCRGRTRFSVSNMGPK